MYYNPKRFFLALMLLLTVSACVSPDLSRNWPDDVPQRSIFVDAFLEKRNLLSVEESQLNEHLYWIVKFYQGTTLYPNGWNRVSDLFLATMAEDRTRNKMRRRLYLLGIEIANEWAQDNDVRLIDNRNVATWGEALQTAAAKNQHEAFVSEVERDVAGLIAGEIQGKDIRYERYFPEEDDVFDNF